MAISHWSDLTPRHGGGAKTLYEAQHRRPILEGVEHPPDLALEGVPQKILGLKEIVKSIYHFRGDNLVFIGQFF